MSLPVRKKRIKRIKGGVSGTYFVNFVYFVGERAL